MMKKKQLDTVLAKELIENESEHTLNASGRGITLIEDIDDENMKTLRKFDISFNLITSLKNITSQMPQLRQLTAYCCQIENIEDIMFGGGKLESMLLQQNGIKSIPKAFHSLTKLKELRLDQNKIQSVTNISSCTSLQVLNLAYNKLRSVDGIEGLQSLEVLILRNNAISMLSNMKLLPSLKEIDISNNLLSSLDGIQIHPLLEIIRAEHNTISTMMMQMPLTSAKVKPQPKPSSKAKSSSKPQDQVSNAPERNSIPSTMHHLSDLFLSHNRISDLKGLECYGNKIETLDLSCNNIDSLDMIYQAFEGTNLSSNMSELDISENPCVKDIGSISMVRQILSSYPALKTINSYSIQYHPDNDDVPGNKTNISSSLLSMDITAANKNFTLICDSRAVGIRDDEISKSVEASVNNDSRNMKASYESDKDDVDDHQDDKDGNENDVQGSITAPKLNFKNVKTIEEIKEKETIFRGLVNNCRVTLANLSVNMSESPRSCRADSRPTSRPFSSRLDQLQSDSALPRADSINSSSKPGTANMKKSKMSGSDMSPHIPMVKIASEPQIHAVQVVFKPSQVVDQQDGYLIHTPRFPTIISEVTAKNRHDDPGLQFLKVRQMQYCTGHRKLSNPSIPIVKVDDGSSLDAQASKGLAEDGITMPPTVPEFSIGFDVRFQKFGLNSVSSSSSDILT